jgi:LEA14-like dessication related protein
MMMRMNLEHVTSEAGSVMRVFIIAIVLLSLSSNGCRNIDVNSVTATIEQLQIVRLSGDNATLKVGFRFDNKNEVEISAENFTYRVVFDGTIAGSGRSVERFNIASGDVTLWWGELRMEGEAAQTVAAKIRNQKPLDYALEGKVRVLKGVLLKEWELNITGKVQPGGER